VERLDRLGAQYGFDTIQLGQLAAVLDAVDADPHAPTAIRDRTRALEAHLADSFVALTVAALAEAGRVADIGSGAGFPGVPLAIALPQATVALVESQTNHCLFLRRVCVRAAIANAAVVCARAEDWPAGVGANDVVTARALAAQPVVLEYAAPLLRLGGTLVDWRGAVPEQEAGAARRTAEILGLECIEVRKVEPFDNANHRYLHLYQKVQATPERFPRRVGMARKKPLG
jgi:16S rRNA (guanine527-N7)-methyltransferase